MNYKIPQFYPFPQNDAPSLTQNVYSNTSSTPWVGFGNTNEDINPLIFTNPGKITFDYEAKFIPTVVIINDLSLLVQYFIL